MGGETLSSGERRRPRFKVRRSENVKELWIVLIQFESIT